MFSSKLKSRAVVLGSWLNIPDSFVLEAMGKNDFDFVLVDGEHGPAHPDTLGRLAPVCDHMDLSLIYRVRRNSPELISAALDAGAAGIMVPMTNTRVEAEAAVAAAKYPPQGRRGFGPWRASDYYRRDMSKVELANAETMVVLQIEHREAVQHLEEIMSVPGVDAVFVGPADLALSMGVPIDLEGPEIWKVYEQVADAAIRHGVICGTDVMAASQSTRLKDMGYSFFTYGGDFTFLRDGAARSSSELREALRFR